MLLRLSSSSGDNVEYIANIPRHSTRVAARLFDGEAVVISPAENTVRMLNRVGSRIWELIDGRRSNLDIAAELVVEYDVPAAEATKQVDAFLTCLAAKGLIESLP